MFRGGRWAVAVLTLLAAASACAPGEIDDPTAQRAQTIRLRVLAAASLTDAMEDLADGFEAKAKLAGTPVEVELNVAGSATLREQILSGAPGDVFVSANAAIMDEVALADEVNGEVQPLAANSMMLVTPADNSRAVDGLEDLADPDLLVGLCTPGVPCGDFAAQVLEQAGVDAEIDTFEDDVRSLMTRVIADELDAAIVYESDVAAAGPAVAAIAIPSELNVEAESQIAVLKGSENPTTAHTFVDFAASAEGRTVLESHGFRTVTP